LGIQKLKIIMPRRVLTERADRQARKSRSGLRGEEGKATGVARGKMVQRSLREEPLKTA